MKLRGFEIARGWEDKEILLPQRATKYSAGYDIAAAEDVIVPPFTPGSKPTLIPTGLKAYCQPDEFYMVVARSSTAKKGLVLSNGIGIIDADYYDNMKNDGHFQILVFNISSEPVTVKKGERLAQVIFQKYLTTDIDTPGQERTGGIGSTSVRRA